MREDLLHFIWKYKMYDALTLKTVSGQTVRVKNPGIHNLHTGPDFFNAQLWLGGQLWAGNVELHIKSSDWYVHHHETDERYNSVILHVVWEDDTAVFRNDNTMLPTLELKQYISTSLLASYQDLFNKKHIHFINCEKTLDSVDEFRLQHWLERLYFERLEQKSIFIQGQLARFQNNWENVLFVLLLRNFGSKVNGASFLHLGQGIDFTLWQKIGTNTHQLESLLMGRANLLQDDKPDQYYRSLKEMYRFLKHKFKLNEVPNVPPEFFKLRPSNFPTIRLSQFAQLYNRQANLFRKLIDASTLEELYDIFNVTASDYWDSHFTFGKRAKHSKKKLHKNFINLLIINSVIPIKFCYARQRGNDISEMVLGIIRAIKREENKLINQYKTYGISAANAMESQALIQLYTNYCSKNKCLQCAIGVCMLKRGNFG